MILDKPEEPGKNYALAFTILVHVALVAFLFFGVQWKRSKPEVMEVELWSPTPMPAQYVPPPPPPPPKPEVKPEPLPKVEPKPAPVLKKPDIVVKEEKKKPEPKKPEPKPEPPKPEPPKPEPPKPDPKTAPTTGGATAPGLSERLAPVRPEPAPRPWRPRNRSAVWQACSRPRDPAPEEYRPRPPPARRCPSSPPPRG